MGHSNKRAGRPATATIGLMCYNCDKIFPVGKNCKRDFVDHIATCKPKHTELNKAS